MQESIGCGLWFPVGLVFNKIYPLSVIIRQSTASNHLTVANRTSTVYLQTQHRQLTYLNLIQLVPVTQKEQHTEAISQNVRYQHMDGIHD